MPLVAAVLVQALPLQLALELVLTEQGLEVPLGYEALDVGLGASEAEVEVAQNKNPIEHVVNHLAGLKSHDAAISENPPDIAVPATPMLGVGREVAVGKQHGGAAHVHRDVDPPAVTKQTTKAGGDVRGTDATDMGAQLVTHEDHEVHAAQALAPDHVVAIPKNLSHLLLPTRLGPRRRPYEQVAVAEAYGVDVVGDLRAQERVQLLQVPGRPPAKNTPDTHKHAQGPCVTDVGNRAAIPVVPAVFLPAVQDVLHGLGCDGLARRSLGARRRSISSCRPARLSVIVSVSVTHIPHLADVRRRITPWAVVGWAPAPALIIHHARHLGLLIHDCHRHRGCGVLQLLPVSATGAHVQVQPIPSVGVLLAGQLVHRRGDRGRARPAGHRLG
mmetsp:Transcript_53501/g.142152  ORF Transcript_53501/g.142152 Transcript_53501/m.142152 type:complete len:387 (-) Transcript_53501:548-1708(-)